MCSCIFNPFLSSLTAVTNSLGHSKREIDTEKKGKLEKNFYVCNLENFKPGIFYNFKAKSLFVDKHIEQQKWC